MPRWSRLENNHYQAYLLAATTGMRRGEVLGLRWEDVDLVRGELSVRQSLTSVGYGGDFILAAEDASEQ